MSSEPASAQYHHRRQHAGFYGVNPTTGIPVCGPYERRDSAQRRVKRINATEPRVPVRDRLRIEKLPAPESRRSPGTSLREAKGSALRTDAPGQVPSWIIRRAGVRDV